MASSIQFSDIDTKILITLCTEMTAFDCLISCGVSHDYGVKRIRHLKKHGWIGERPEGTKRYYSTKLIPETEHFFEVAQASTSNSKVFKLINFYGQNLTLGQAVGQESHRTKQLKGAMHLPDFVGKVVSTLKVRSYRAAKGLDSQNPREETLREWLQDYVTQTKRNLKLAEEVLNCRKLWDGSPTTWKWISDSEPSEATLKHYNDMNKLTYKEQD